ncbi:MAG: protein kinase [Planctomycetia bacterium]|nr:protein kinase [Planctomycetia bacterium]
MAPTAEQLGLRAVQIGLISERDLRAAWAELGTKNVDLQTFTQLLIRKELLTNYQIKRLEDGATTRFFFGDYKVLYLVGRGTFARVYRAVSKTGEVVAIKVLRTKYNDNPDSCMQFEREGELGKSLQHPNIVSIKDVYSQGNVHFIAMEFIEGQSLREFINIRKKLTAEEAIPIMRDIAAGLQFAFEHGMTHRDLKLTNVMITSRGVAKLADFGFATVDQSLQNDDPTADIPNPRTLDYAGLERVTNVLKDDTRSDIYFAGCIYYHLLCGEPPLYETKDRLERTNPSRFTNVPPLQDKDASIPLPICMIVNKAMALDVRKRYQTPGEMLRDIKLLEKQIKDNPGKSLDPSILRVNRPAMIEHSIMVVERDDKLREVFRDALKKMGYRVLVTADAERAIERFYQDKNVADCILLNAQNIGEEAVRVFNEVRQLDQENHFIPAVLLLAKNQKFWSEMSEQDDYRVVVQMPVTMKQLALVLTKLLSKKFK